MPPSTEPTNDLAWMIVVSGFVWLSVFMLIQYGWRPLCDWLRSQVEHYDKVLNHQLLLRVNPKLAVGAGLGLIVLASLAMAIVLSTYWIAPLGTIIGVFICNATVQHLAQKRLQRLDLQLIDGVTALASGVRAGLTLIQSMELMVNNSSGPIQQEFSQLLREYQMGLDLNQCMRNTAKRIGSSNYRLLFTAIEMHRIRGGDSGESLDRICESIREIQRLEGKLDAITAQGRAQAWMMAIAPLGIIAIYGTIVDSEGVQRLFIEPLGRMVLLMATLLIIVGFLWIRRIMAVDI